MRAITIMGRALSRQQITSTRAVDRTCAASKLNGVIKALCALVAPCTNATCAAAQITNKASSFILLHFLGSDLLHSLLLSFPSIAVRHDSA